MTGTRTFERLQTPGRSALSLNTVGYVSRHGGRAKPLALGAPLTMAKVFWQRRDLPSSSRAIASAAFSISDASATAKSDTCRNKGEQ